MEELLPWLSLKSVPGVGSHLFKRLMDAFGSPESVFEASHHSLCEVEGMTEKLARVIAQHTPSDQVKRELDLVAQKGYRIVTLGDSDFPPLLRQIPDPPAFLYVLGSLGKAMRTIAVVGSRNATDYGISTTKRLCANLASLDIVVVSGMAKGIDTAAHEGALQGRGNTIAVLGSGLDRVYPAENLDLYHRISQNGAVVSEFPLMTEPEAYNFPIRNRIISGICLGTVVVEATRKSGSLITARLAAEQNREVFAVPGSISSFKSMGTHTLIKEGAKLVEHAQDIVEEIASILEPSPEDGLPEDGDALRAAEPMPELSDEESQVFGILGPYPVHIDELVRKLEMPPGKLSSVLLQLELKQVVQQSPGKLFCVSDRFLS